MNKEKYLPRTKTQLKVNVEFTIPYWEYLTKKENKLAEMQIKDHIKMILEDHRYFDLKVEKDEYDNFYDDCTGKAKIKVK